MFTLGFSCLEVSWVEFMKCVDVNVCCDYIWDFFRGIWEFLCDIEKFVMLGVKVLEEEEIEICWYFFGVWNINGVGMFFF